MLYLLLLFSTSFSGLSLGCEENEFLCRFSHACIPMEQKCDNIIQCPHAEDEHNCPSSCNEEEFLCDGLCMSNIFYCDGFNDCQDRTDEAHCPSFKTEHLCPKNYFKCAEGTCIPNSFLCNGEPDCQREEDEEDCPGLGQVVPDHGCPEPNYRCRDSEGTCMPKRFVCDGSPDCKDGSDETGCGNLVRHHACNASQGMFVCGKDEVSDHLIRCLQPDQVCNGKPQCPHGEDEGPMCDDKKCATFDCEHSCLETPQGPQCYCKNGFTLGADQKNCEDIDECKQYGTCSQTCQNTKGGFECRCTEGYILKNSTKCIFSGLSQLFLASEEEFIGEIRTLELHTHEYYPVVTGISKPVGVAYDPLNNQLFWTDSTPGRSVVEQKQLLHNSSGTAEIFIETGLENPQDITVEAASGLLFFTDAGKGQIAACSIETKYCTIISKEHLQLRGIAVHAEKKLLFVTEWGSKPQIVRMNLDGSDKSTLLKSDIVWPNGVAVDASMNRVYWTDAQRDSIESVDIYGFDRRVVVKDVYHPFGIVVFEDTVYWSDWHDYKLYSCNKFTGKDIKVLLEVPFRINGISHHHAYPIEHSSPCSKAKCSHICIPSTSSHTCRCPQNMYLDFDAETCVHSRKNNGLIVAYGNNVYSLKPQNLGKINLDSVGVVENGIVTEMSTNALNGHLFVHTDLGNVVSVNSYTKSSQAIYRQNNMKMMAFDNNQNLFWIDEKKKSIVVKSQKSKLMRTIFNCENPKTLIYMKSWNFIAFIDGKSLHVSSVDGMLTRIVSSKLPDDSVLLAYSEKTETFYIAGSGSIRAYSEKVGYLEDVVLGTGYPTSMVVQDGYLYWTEKGSNLLSWININRHEENKVSKLTIGSLKNHTYHLSSWESEDVNDLSCEFKSCSDICLATSPINPMCVCGDGRSIVRYGDGAWSKCQDDFAEFSEKTESNDLNDSKEKNALLIGLLVGIVLLSILLVVFCCVAKRRHLKKSAEFLNRSFGLIPSPKKSEQGLNPVAVLSCGARNEIENPGFYSVELGFSQAHSTLSHPSSRPRSFAPGLRFPAPQDTQGERTKEGMLPSLLRTIRHYRDPKMVALDWNENTVPYETLVAARGSSTPSLRRMETIDEKDSAYNELSGSMDYEEDSSNDRNMLVV